MATRDAEATRRRLLDAGLREFSDKGIAGARVDAIAERAQTNKRMLYYYFGSKEGLFREILRRHLSERLGGGGLTAERMAAPDRLSSRQARHVADRDYTRLLEWEALESGPSGAVENEEERRAFYRQWVALVAEAQADGRLPADLDPAQYVLTELLVTLGPFLIPQVVRLLTGRSVTDPAFVAERAEFLDALERRLRG